MTWQQWQSRSHQTGQRPVRLQSRPRGGSPGPAAAPAQASSDSYEYYYSSSSPERAAKPGPAAKTVLPEREAPKRQPKESKAQDKPRKPGRDKDPQAPARRALSVVGSHRLLLRALRPLSSGAIADNKKRHSQKEGLNPLCTRMRAV
ncbi:unnamed protein product [Symbiodinium natans]|uniref:Uncharacterized protein n=1 Tax=Symbiodinium natans TaxID=878477 RepID=A0A812NDX2_9DINO|nr:unnamed protein product [Symbiodinium natans]